eukprot:167144-Amphidinium_carterae.1
MAVNHTDAGTQMFHKSSGDGVETSSFTQEDITGKREQSWDQFALVPMTLYTPEQSADRQVWSELLLLLNLLLRAAVP